MKSKKTNKQIIFVYYLGIGFGIVFCIAFITSQLVMPLFFGRAKTIEVPNLSGMTVSQAKNILTTKKLHSVVKDSIWSEETKTGRIISQKPSAGSYLKPDGTVYVIISKGTKNVRMPDVIGLSVQAAWIQLKNAGLYGSVVDSLYSEEYPVNTVVQTSPVEGKLLTRQSRVKLYISKGRTPLSDSLEATGYW